MATPFSARGRPGSWSIRTELTLAGFLRRDLSPTGRMPLSSSVSDAFVMRGRQTWLSRR